MAKTNLLVNGEARTVDTDPGTPLLWVLREDLKLNGTKFGCGIAQCGACTVHLDGQPVRSCSTPVGAVEGAAITTIEGVSGEDGTRHAVQQAWIEHQVPQCGTASPDKSCRRSPCCATIRIRVMTISMLRCAGTSAAAAPMAVFAPP